jgi:LPS export ABC transporter protein LptC
MRRPPVHERLPSRRPGPSRAALAAGLLLGSALALGGCARGAGDASADDATERAVDPGYSATDAQVVETDAGGAPRYSLRAASIQQDPRSLEVNLRQLSMQVSDGADAPWQITARDGRMPEDASRIELRGEVRVAGTVGRDGESIEIRSDILSYDIASSLARSTSDVTIRLSGKWLQAHGIEANLKQRQVRLESKVHGRFVP